jgi:hypothetical protein
MALIEEYIEDKDTWIVPPKQTMIPFSVVTVPVPALLFSNLPVDCSGVK